MRENLSLHLFCILSYFWLHAHAISYLCNSWEEYGWRRIIEIVVLWLDNLYWMVTRCPRPLVGIPYGNTAAKAAGQQHCLSSPGKRTTKVRLVFIERRVESLCKSLVLRYNIRQSKLAMSSAPVTATLAFSSGAPCSSLQGVIHKQRLSQLRCCSSVLHCLCG